MLDKKVAQLWGICLHIYTILLEQQQGGGEKVTSGSNWREVGSCWRQGYSLCGNWLSRSSVKDVWKIFRLVGLARDKDCSRSVLEHSVKVKSSTHLLRQGMGSSTGTKAVWGPRGVSGP